MFDVMFFATRPELLLMIDAIESSVSVFATPMGLYDSPNYEIYPLRDLPALEPDASIAELRRQFLLVQSPKVVARAVQQKRGGVKYAINPTGNEGAWILITGGEPSPEILIPGRISGSSSAFGDSIIKSFGAVTQGYSVVGPFLVSQRAFELGKHGGRLVASGNPNSPTQLDLKP